MCWTEKCSWWYEDGNAILFPLLLPSPSCLSSTSLNTSLLLIMWEAPFSYQHIRCSLLSRFPPASLKISFMLWSTKVTHLTPCCRDCRSSFTSLTKSHQSPKWFSLCEWQGNYWAEWHGWRSAFTQKLLLQQKPLAGKQWLTSLGLLLWALYKWNRSNDCNCISNQQSVMPVIKCQLTRISFLGINWRKICRFLVNNRMFIVL